MSRQIRCHPYRASGAGQCRYFEDADLAETWAQALANEADETIKIERCVTTFMSPTKFAVSLLNNEDWCDEHRIIRYVKPQKDRLALMSGEDFVQNQD